MRVAESGDGWRAKPFEGFGDGAVEFFEGLSEDNSKAYWNEHQERYRVDVREPMAALLAELEPEFAPGFGSGKVFRPYRDLRFARDKSPYKTHCGAVIEPGRGAGAYYVDVSAEGMTIAGGCFFTASDQLARYRAAVGEPVHADALAAMLDELRELGWEVDGARLRSRPRGCPPDHPYRELLRHRTLYATRHHSPDDALHTRAALERVRTGWRQLRGLNRWCAEHIGVTERRR